MNISQNIKKMRKTHGMEQKELAELLNISNKTVSSWETGRTEPNIGMIEKMCKIFDCSKSELIDGKTTPQDTQIIFYAERISRLPDEKRKHLFAYMEYLENMENNK